MSLDNKRQSMLDVFCHVYGTLLDYLDNLDEAAPRRSEWDGYWVVRECVNPAAAKFGRTPGDMSDFRALCMELLRRIRGSLNLELPKSRSTIHIFSELSKFEAAVTRAVAPPPANIDLLRSIGEVLSVDCYDYVCPRDSPNLSRLSYLEIIPSNQQDFKSEPRKHGGASRITFRFSTTDFTFDTYVNLPFYFLHEYLSHIHSAPLFAEQGSSEASPAFEDGWLLYAAHRHYCDKLGQHLRSSISHPRHREYFATKYMVRVTGDEGKRMVCRGHDVARQFDRLVSTVTPDLFWKVTLLVATTPFNHLLEHVDLHQEFVRRCSTWVRQMQELPVKERSPVIGLMTSVVNATEPIRGIFDILGKPVSRQFP